MSDATISALLASIPLTLTAVTTLVVAWRTSTKTDKVIDKADRIHELTNSRLTEVTTALDVANAKISGMDKLLAEMTVNKAVALAQAGNQKPPQATKAP